MKKSGQVILFQFPQTNMAQGKLRPAILLGKLPGSILLGTIGEIDTERLKRIKVRLSEWFKKV
ncbi:MAG: hypothetical protein DPW09_37315 [Anaerolineae bacterium]|nr:hypothetical protein [Anaerolineae bacterium]